MKVCFAILVKFPRPGRSKNRIAVHLGAENAARIQKAMLLDTLERFTQMKDINQISVVFPFDEQPEPFIRLFRNNGIPITRLRFLKGVESMNADIVNAYRKLLGEFERVVVTGADLPQYSEIQLQELLTALNQVDAAFHPNEDDGCCPHGLRRFADMWTGNDSQTPGYIMRWKLRAETAGLSCRALSSTFDVDKVEDLIRLQQEYPASCPRTMRLLRVINFPNY